MFERIQVWDERWTVRINNHTFGKVIKNFFIYFTHIGSVIPWIVVCLILFIINQDTLASILGFGLIEFGLIQFLFKLVVHRQRPYKNEKIKDKIELRDFLLRNGGQSLPSGHVAAFTMVNLVLAYFFNNYYLLLISVPALVFVCYSRVYLGAHYPTDVFMGIIFGILYLFLVIASRDVAIWFFDKIEEIFFIP